MMKPNARSPSLTSQGSYSAVIIADLVADVPTMQPDIEPEALRTTKEATNLAYDGQMDGEPIPAVVREENETTNKHANGMKMNGSGSISKGVILNAVQFGKADPNAKTGEKSIQLTNALSTAQPLPEPSGFKDMSPLRKMAFAFSFLPSILFVLCFAIILPCKVPSPCVEEMWLKDFNDAEAMSNLILTPNVAFTLLEKGKPFLMTLSADTGSVLNQETIPARPAYMNCGKVINDKENYCIVMDEAGNFYTFNSSNSELLWDSVIESGKTPSSPVILPDCDGDGIEEIAVAVSNTEIKVLIKGNVVYKVEFQVCDTVPTQLIPWTRSNLTDIVFTCKKEGKDTIVKVPQKAWCKYDKKKSSGSILAFDIEVDSSRGYLLHPTEDGLVLWTGDNVTMLLPNGDELWKFSNNTHSDTNRFILHGNFSGGDRQIALLSSDLSSTLQVTVLNSTDGSVMKSSSFLNSEVTQILGVKGTEKDFAIVILKKMRKTVVDKALEHIEDISTTIVNYLSNETFIESPAQFSTDISEEIAFLDLHGSFHSIKEIDFNDKLGNVSKSTMTVSQDKENLLIYLLSLSTHSESRYVTKIRSVKVNNWDISSSKELKCALK